MEFASTTVRDLYERAAQELSSSSSSQASPSVQLRAGVPPRTLDCDSDAAKTLRECGIRHQDRVLVDIIPDDANNTPSTTTQSTSPNEPSEPRRRTKRKAAQAATEAFPAVIAEQEKIARQQQKQTRTKTTATQNKKKKSTSSAARHFAALERKTTTTDGVGAFRLRDGKPIERKKAPSPKRRTELGGNSATSLEEALVSSAGGGALRSGWRKAVASAYEHNQAAARVAALTRDCVFQLTTEQADANRTLHVTYPKGVQGRGTFTDEVTFLPLDALAAAVRSVPQREGLRHMPLLSPRVYWSLRYHLPDCRTVQECLEAVAPELDWQFLRHRQRTLSAKARENLRQQKEEEEGYQQDEEEDWEAAAAAIAAVEDAMSNGENVALQRGVAVSQTSATTWRVATPDEEDLDELKECVEQRILADDPSIDELANSLVENGIHNWRQLANRTTSDCSILRTEWIDYAQAQSLEEIMVEICEGDCEAVATLRDDANTGTPRDLALWRRVPSTLQQQVPSYTTVQLQRWCDRAVNAIEQLPWLLDFETPI